MVQRILSKRLAVAGAATAVGAGAIAGTALVAHGSSSAAPVATAATSSSTPAPSSAQQPRAKHGERRGKPSVLEVRSASGDTLVVVDHSGASHTFRIGPRTRVLGPDAKPEAATGLRPGEIVVVVAARAPKVTAKNASPSPAASSNGETPTAAVIEDTGFAAR